MHLPLGGCVSSVFQVDGMGMTPRTLSEVPLNCDRSNWTLRANRTLAEAGIQGFVGERGDRKVGWFAAAGWIAFLADIVWRIL